MHSTSRSTSASSGSTPLLDRLNSIMVKELLEAKAKEHDGQALTILGHEVDKTDAREVYGALCWIEEQLIAMSQRGVAS